MHSNKYLFDTICMYFCIYFIFEKENIFLPLFIIIVEYTHLALALKFLLKYKHSKVDMILSSVP